MKNKEHWENIYTNKNLVDLSWYQAYPKTSLWLIRSSHCEKSAPIIDVGGGDGFLVDHLLEDGYTDITVLDISEAAIEKAKKRLGSRAELVDWIISDITDFKPKRKYVIWHDRAAFHFLTEADQIDSYKNNLCKTVSSKSQLIIGTFSESGPDRCSGINIKKYSKEKLAAEFQDRFKVIELLNEDHETPFKTSQNFTFAHLEYKS